MDFEHLVEVVDMMVELEVQISLVEEQKHRLLVLVEEQRMETVVALVVRKKELALVVRMMGLA